MEQSILLSTKKLLGVDESLTVFDTDILVHINSVFGDLDQIGIGPVGGFEIQDADANWDDFLLGDKRLSAVKSYMYLRVRLLFDTPQTSFLIDSMQRNIEKLEWRLNAYREETAWVDPNLAA